MIGYTCVSELVSSREEVVRKNSGFFYGGQRKFLFAQPVGTVSKYVT